jgi:hypothetical protein
LAGMGADMLNETRPDPKRRPYSQRETINYNTEDDRIITSFYKVSRKSLRRVLYH